MSNCDQAKEKNSNYDELKNSKSNKTQLKGKQATGELGENTDANHTGGNLF